MPRFHFPRKRLPAKTATNTTLQLVPLSQARDHRRFLCLRIAPMPASTVPAAPMATSGAPVLRGASGAGPTVANAADDTKRARQPVTIVAVTNQASLFFKSFHLLQLNRIWPTEQARSARLNSCITERTLPARLSARTEHDAVQLLFIGEYYFRRALWRITAPAPARTAPAAPMATSGAPVVLPPVLLLPEEDPPVCGVLEPPAVTEANAAVAMKRARQTVTTAVVTNNAILFFNLSPPPHLYIQNNIDTLFIFVTPVNTPSGLTSAYIPRFHESSSS